MVPPVSRAWLFKEISEGQIRRWATSLRYFRFCRAQGGHANDPDELLAALRIDSEGDLLAVTERLGVTLVPVRPDAPGAASPIDELPQWEQPGHRSLNGCPAFVWVKNGALEIHLHGANGDVYSVTNADVHRARKIEELLSSMQDRLIDPPIQSALCICPKFHPHYWNGSRSHVLALPLFGVFVAFWVYMLTGIHQVHIPDLVGLCSFAAAVMSLLGGVAIAIHGIPRGPSRLRRIVVGWLVVVWLFLGVSWIATS